MKATYLAILLLLGLFTSCKERQVKAHGQVAMSTNEALLKTNFENFIEFAWNDGNADSLNTLLEENFVKHLNGIRIAENKSEMEANMNIYFKGFPDGKVSVGNIQVKGKDLFAQWVYTGTNTGMFGEYPPTGKKVTVHGHTHVAFNEAGKMISEIVYYNELELLQQLGYTLNPPVLE